MTGNRPGENFRIFPVYDSSIWSTVYLLVNRTQDALHQTTSLVISFSSSKEKVPSHSFRQRTGLARRREHPWITVRSRYLGWMQVSSQRTHSDSLHQAPPEIGGMKPGFDWWSGTNKSMAPTWRAWTRFLLLRPNGMHKVCIMVLAFLPFFDFQTPTRDTSSQEEEKDSTVTCRKSQPLRNWIQ